MTFIDTFKLHIQNRNHADTCAPLISLSFWSSPRPISSSQLHTFCCASTSALYLPRRLQGVLRFSRMGISSRASRRCLQRLSLQAAALPMQLYYNRYTSGLSIGPLRTKDSSSPNILRPRRIGTELSHDVSEPGSRTRFNGRRTAQPADLLQPRMR